MPVSTRSMASPTETPTPMDSAAPMAEAEMAPSVISSTCLCDDPGHGLQALLRRLYPCGSAGGGGFRGPLVTVPAGAAGLSEGDRRLAGAHCGLFRAAAGGLAEDALAQPAQDRGGPGLYLCGSGAVSHRLR